ncbi:MAG: methyltransferase domain-containing protein [Candidatus Hydrogenedentales bacterium]|jgi:SAM-dependent methyltransferase
MAEPQDKTNHSSDLDRQYRRQAAWFAGERNRLLRKVDIASKKRVLDLGTGTGVVLPDLAWRCGGVAVGVDCDVEALRLAQGVRVAGRAESLPFPDHSFDLVFTQMFFLWVKDLRLALSEIARVIEPGGHLVAAAEPDYGGVIECPERTAGLKAYGDLLRSEGADTQVGSKLGAALHAAGFEATAGVHPCDPLSSTASETGGDEGPVKSKSDFAFLPYFHYLCRMPR